MADQEIAKHTKNMWAVMTSGEHGAWHKLREMALEIVIIVFAVSLSIWLHSVGEHRHEQAQVKTFLLGLKRDIQSDLVQAGNVVAFHHAADEQYAYLATRDSDAAPEREKFNAAYQRIDTNNFLVSRVARYEGFKSSGKLTNIENQALLENIVDLFQYDIPKVSLASKSWLSNHDKLLAYVDEHTGEDDSLTVRYKMITSRKGRLLNERMVTYPQLYQRFQAVIDKGNAIIKDIDAAYPGS